MHLNITTEMIFDRKSKSRTFFYFCNHIDWGWKSWLLNFHCLPDVLWLLVICGSSSRWRELVCSVWWLYFLSTYFLIALYVRFPFECQATSDRKSICKLNVHRLSILPEEQSDQWIFVCFLQQISHWYMYSGHSKIDKTKVFKTGGCLV